MRRDFLDSPEGERALGVPVNAVKAHSPERYAQLCRSILQWGRKLPGQEKEPLWLDRLADIELPTIVIGGDSDRGRTIPAAFGKRIADRIPGARFVEIPDCGHIPLLERPDKVSEIIAGFVKEQARQVRRRGRSGRGRRRGRSGGADARATRRG